MKENGKGEEDWGKDTATACTELRWSSNSSWEESWRQLRGALRIVASDRIGWISRGKLGIVGGVLPGRGSEETWMEAPVVSLISLIFTPSFPMMAPHWLLGTNKFRCKSNSSSPSPDLLPDSLNIKS